jgi:hypothetical protein
MTRFRVHSLLGGASLWTEPLCWADAVSLSASFLHRGMIGDILLNDGPRHRDLYPQMEGQEAVLVEWGGPCGCGDCPSVLPGQCRAALIRPVVKEEHERT